MRVYELLITFLPILAVYKSPIPGVDFGTFCALFSFPFTNKHIKFYSNKVFWLLLGYVLLDTVFNLLGHTEHYSTTTSILMRTFRFLLMMTILPGIDREKNFDIHFFLKCLRWVTLFVCIYAILQSISFHFTGYKLINVIAPTKQGVVFHNSLRQYETIYRPPSIFLEPSAVTYYIVPFLCFCLFEPNYELYVNSKSGLRDAIIITIGVLATTSGQGIVVLGCLWLLFIFNLLISKKNNNKTFKIIIVITGVLTISTWSVVAYSIGRIFNTSGMSAVDARIVGYATLSQLNTMQKIFGSGFGNYIETIYYSSYADILFCLGYVGLALNCIYFGTLFKNGMLFQRALVIVLVILMGSSGIYTATYLCFYLPLIVYSFPNISRNKILDNVSGYGVDKTN